MREGVGKDAKTPKQKQVRRNRWIAIAGGVLASGFVFALAFFGLQYFRDTAYQDERAFRVLGHIVGQFGNLQDAIAGAVQLGIVDRDCKAIPSYVGRLALRGDVKFDAVKAPTSETNGDGVIRAAQSFRIDPKSSGRTFSVHDRRTKPNCDVVLSGPLRDQIPVFINQMLFDQVVIATESGDVLARVPRGHDQSQQVQLHNVASTDLFGGNVASLLRRAVTLGLKAENAEEKKEQSAPNPAAPGTSTVHSHEVGGQSFRIFVLPFEPTQETYIDQNRATRLYLVGLTRQNVLQSMSEALGSGGALVITLGVLLCVLSWPFVSLRFASPQEAIGPAQIVALLLAMLLIPAVVATSGFSIWTRHKLMLWADQHAEIYAYRVESALIQEMDSSLHVLESLAAQIASNKGFVDARFNVTPTGAHTAVACVPPHKCEVPLKLELPPALPPNWSPIRSAAPLNADGASAGLTLSFFQGNPAGEQLNLRDREYFLALKAGDDWRAGSLWHDGAQADADEHRYVAQRLFNRSDAARALQLAVPIDLNTQRIGLFTGDTRAYPLSASLRPPLLRFAVFDHRNGALIFHSHDERSLAENLLVETEGNAVLSKAMLKRASTWSQRRIRLADHFSGRYMGSAHRFYHRAIPGTPWGLVVLYETDAINTIVLQTAVASLATYFAFVGLAALVLGLLVILLRQRVDIQLLERIWPKWRSREHYRIIRLVGLGLLALLVIAAIGKLNHANDVLLIALALAIVAMIAAAVAVRMVPRFASEAKRRRGPSFVTYKRSYVQSTFVVLCLISAVPASMIAVGYHDTSVHAFIRDELLNAAVDEEQRRRVILRDDRRFNDITEVNVERAETLSRELPVPGYRFEKAELQSWLVTDALPAPWLSECGPPVLGLYRRWVWILSTARQVQRPIASNARSLGDEALERAAPNTTETRKAQESECPEFAVRARRRSDDGTRVSIALPLSAHDDDIHPIGSCPPGRAPQELCHDEELHALYRHSDAMMLAAVMFGSALLLLLLSAHVARRLCGVRIPFAGRFVPSSADEASAAALLDAEMELVRLKNTEGLQLTSKDESDWRASRCEPIYRQMWEALEQAHDQQLLLLHLAHGRYANPENQLVIEQLLQRGYITLAPWPRIIEPGFAEFIRRVHPSDALDELRYEASHTPWSQWRTPVLIVVIIIAGMLMWLAGSAMHILMGVLGGVATLFGSITQVTSFIHREKPK